MSLHTVTITIEASSQSFPAGTQPAGIKVSLGALAPVMLTAAPYVATFEGVEAGDYVTTAQAVDVNDAGLGDAITAACTVAPDAVNVDVPTSMSIAVV